MDNPFALIVLSAQKALLQGKVAEEELAVHRLTIARALIQSKKFSHKKIAKLLFFLKNFLYIKSEEINRNFDEQVHQLTGKKITMDIIETIKKIEREEGREEGIGQKNYEFVQNLLTNTDFSVRKIAALANVTEAFVRKVKKETK